MQDVTQDSSPETVVEKEEVAPVVSEDEKTPTEGEPKNPPPEEKTVPYSRFKEKVDEIESLKKQKSPQPSKAALDVEDYIDISASLEGLDQKEKERLAREHKLTGKPLSEIRKDEDFLLWQSAHRAKVEKETKNLKPTNTQVESDRPKSLDEKLESASLAEKEKILTDAGLYKAPKPRPDRVHIGTER